MARLGCQPRERAVIAFPPFCQRSLLTPGSQTVCRHWLKGLCMKGNACGFLHQFEAACWLPSGPREPRLMPPPGAHARVPLFRQVRRVQGAGLPFQVSLDSCDGSPSGLSPATDAPSARHSSEDIKDCNMYKLGFCIHGPHW